MKAVVANPLLRSGFLGIISALSFAPFNIFPIFLITFAWFFIKICESEKSKQLLLEAFCFFFGLHVACLYWLVYPLTFDLEKHWILIPFAITLIPAYLSAFLLIPTFFVWKKAKKNPLLFALSYCLTMKFYGCFLPGFPWVLPGYIWCCDEIFLQTVSIYGIYGLSFVTLLISGYLGLSFLHYRSNNIKKIIYSAIIVGSFLAFIMLFGQCRLENNPTVFTNNKARIIQANISQKNKNDHNFAFSNLKKHLQLSRHDSQVDLVIWPEASIPYLYKENFAQLHDYLKSFLNKSEYLLAGAVRQDLSTGKIHNSVVVIDHNGINVANYDKRKLLPFGEYVPFRKYIPFQGIASDIGDFDPGEKTNILNINGMKIAFAICYEIVFPSEKDVDLIINITNDGWFGFTTEPFQHLQISRVRAIENGVPLLRATNYGISVVFDPCGREIARIPVDETGTIEINIPKKIKTLF
ncbi:MAG: apolipoprotein N-acyltransferase [Holosporaceae bacterium]|jgi:apolipoprotein N-acyltransferase|nr:apolipoprotein N-acyltransferase [Holosporaceae bacterium]